jgi:ABC-2 type transport system permease protein
MAIVTKRVHRSQSFMELLADVWTSGGCNVAVVLSGLAVLLGLALLWYGSHYELPTVRLRGQMALSGGLVLAGAYGLRSLLYLISYRTALTMDRELLAYFSSPVAYIVLAGMIVIYTLNYWDLVNQLRELRIETVGQASPVVSFIAWNLWFWLSLLFVVPALTMRLVAEEKRVGTIETLLSAPVREVEVVLGKFLAAFVFYCLLQSPSVLYLVRLRFFANYEFELMPVLATYLGLMSVGAMFLSIGLFCSSTTRNQIVAAMTSFAVMLVLFATFVFQWYAERSFHFEVLSDVLRHVSVLLHLYDLGTGKVNPAYFFFHLSVAALMLYLATKMVQMRRAS